MRLIKAKASQKEEIFSLILEKSQWIKSLGINQWPVKWVESQRDEIFKSVSDGFFYTHFEDNALAVVVELRTEPEDIWANDSSKSLYIHKLAVSNAFKGQGLGRCIMEEIIMWAKVQSFSYVRLDCAAGNTRLREYYESIGFYFVRAEVYGGFDSALFQVALNEK